MLRLLQHHIVIKYFISVLFIIMFVCITQTSNTNAIEESEMKKNRIQIYKENPRYWQYKGKPILLIGGSVDDNLFQIPNLKEHLELLKSVGGNYVRSTMGWTEAVDVPPFKKVGDLYDLNQWNDEFWTRFQNFIRWTHEMDIIVQIEVWATFNYYRDYWEVNPFNPKNNSNYSTEETELPTAVNSHPSAAKNDFFRSVPKKRNQEIVLKYQQKYVDKLLSETLPYGHILYCMDNETAVTPAWGEYWSTYIKNRATEVGRGVETTESWNPWEIDHEQHLNTKDHPEIYSFCDISQNNMQKRQTHWDNAQKYRAELSPIRPMNNVKIYGADTGKYGTTRNGLERFWRNIFGGLASARFHRPPNGLGLTKTAQASLKSMRMITDEIDVFNCEPNNELLSNREDNEAYTLANPGKEYALYFPKEGSVDLDLSVNRQKDAKTVNLRWLNISKGEWKKEQEIPFSDSITLSPPTESHWAVLVKFTQVATKGF